MARTCVDSLRMLDPRDPPVVRPGIPGEQPVNCCYMLISCTPIYMIQTLHTRLASRATMCESRVVSRDFACLDGLKNRTCLLLFDIDTIASILVQRSHPSIARLSEQQWSSPPPPRTSPLRAAPRPRRLKRPRPRPAGSRTT